MNIQEMAGIAGDSTATASGFLDRPASLSPALRARIREAVMAHRCHPGLSGNQRDVAIILPYDAVHPVRSCIDMLPMGLVQALPLHGVRIGILPVNSLDRLVGIQFRAALAIGVDSGGVRGRNGRFPVPRVIVERDMRPVPEQVHVVQSDEAQGMEPAIRHLGERGGEPGG